MKISVVIPNYNGEALLKENLPKVLEAIGDAEVIVVDDASFDGSVENIKYQISNIKNKNQKSNIKLIRNEKNLGFSSTVNRGVREATGDLIVLLNSDVIPESNFLDPLINHFNDPKVFAVGCLQKGTLRKGISVQGRGIGKFSKGFLMHSPGKIDKKNTLWVFGGAGMYRKSIWEELGGMEEIYSPFYWEDIDLSYRALKAGYKLIFEPKSAVEHQQETTIKSQYSQSKIKTIAYRNQIFFVWLNITDRKLIFQHILYLPYHFIKSLLTLDLLFIKALFHAFIFLPWIFIKRHKNIKTFRLNDNEVFLAFLC